MKSISYLSLAGLVVSLIVNMLAVQLPINGLTPPEISNLYPNLFVPANITFSIWSVIYLALFAYVIYFIRQAGRGQVGEVLSATHPWFLLTCLFNAAWIVAWHYLMVEIALLIMLFLLFSLAVIYQRMYLSEEEGIWWTRVPFSLYLGWICVALIANTTALLVHYEFSGIGLSEAQWTVIMMSAATMIGSTLAIYYRDPIILLAIIWALLGIYIKRNPYLSADEKNIHIASLVLIIALSVVELYLIVKRKSSETSPG